MRRLTRLTISAILLTLSTVNLASTHSLKPMQIILKSGQTKTKNLPVIDINQDLKDELKTRLNTIESPHSSKHEKVDLTMNSVPVFDQGSHGSCATFALTASIDAERYQSDHISQLCVLQLQKSLNHTDSQRFPTLAWHGTMIEQVYGVIDKFGIVPKTNEATAQCGGLQEYPQMSPDEGQVMFLPYYMANAEILENITVKPLLLTEDAFTRNTDTQLILQDIKNALRQKKRVTIGVAFNPGFNSGFVGETSSPYDTWLLTPELKQKIISGNYQQLGFHAVVLYGFDDDAVVKNANGAVVNKGVFKLRNSWGPFFGDHGDGYVTYDYLQVMLTEAHIISST